MEATESVPSSTSTPSKELENYLKFLRGMSDQNFINTITLPNYSKRVAPPRRGFTEFTKPSEPGKSDSSPSRLYRELDNLLRAARENLSEFEDVPGQKLPPIVIPEIKPSNKLSSDRGRALGDVFRPSDDDLMIYPWDTIEATPPSPAAVYYPGRQLPEKEAPTTVSTTQTVLSSPPPPPAVYTQAVDLHSASITAAPTVSAVTAAPTVSAVTAAPTVSAVTAAPTVSAVTAASIASVPAAHAASAVSMAPASAVSAARVASAVNVAGERVMAQYGSYGPIEDPDIADVVSYASQVSTSTTTTASTTPTPSTPDPLLLEMRKDMSIPNVGYFSAALTKLFELIAAKDADLAKRLFFATQEVIQKKSDELRLDDLGYPLRPALEKGSILLSVIPVDMAQKNIGIAVQLMKNRSYLDSKYTSILYELDRLYTMHEGEKLFRSIIDVNYFPDNGIRAKTVMKNIVTALMSPFIRLQGSDRVRNILTLVNGLIEEKFPSLMSSGRRSDPKSKYYIQRYVRPRSRFDEQSRRLSKRNNHKASKSYIRNTNDKTILQISPKTIMSYKKEDLQRALSSKHRKLSKQNNYKASKGYSRNANYKSSNNKYSMQITPMTNKSYKKEELRNKALSSKQSEVSKQNNYKASKSYLRNTNYRTIFTSRYPIQITPKTVETYKKKKLRSKTLSIETDRDYGINTHRHKTSLLNRHEKHKVRKHLKSKHRDLYEKLKHKHNKYKTLRSHTNLPINRLYGDGYEHFLRSKYFKLNDSIDSNIDGRKRNSHVKVEPTTPTIQKRFNIIHTRSPQDVIKKSKNIVLPSPSAMSADNNTRKYLLENSIKTRFNNFQESVPKFGSKMRASDKIAEVRKELFSDSSYSEDAENTLKLKLQDTLRHGERRFAERVYQTKARNINDMSSYSDEESVLKRNIYKAFAT